MPGKTACWLPIERLGRPEWRLLRIRQALVNAQGLIDPPTILRSMGVSDRELQMLLQLNGMIEKERKARG